MIEEDDQGWKLAPDDRYVCEQCFDDAALKEFIITGRHDGRDGRDGPFAWSW